MGVEYRNFLLPHDRNFVAQPDRIHALVERLRAEQWVLTPDNPVFAIFVEAWRTPPEPSDHHSTGGWAEPFIEKAASPRDRWEKARSIPIPVDRSWIAALRDPGSKNAQADELALHFSVSAPDESWSDLDMPYPLAYGEDEPGYHDILVYASRDLVWHPGYDDIHCACGAALTYGIERATIAPIDFERRIRSACGACSRSLDANAEDLDGAAFHFAVVIDCGKGWPVQRRVGEPQGHMRALEAAGDSVVNPPIPRERAPEDTPGSPGFDAQVLRSPYGDPAPPIGGAFWRMVEETIGTTFESIPEFY